MTSVIKCLWDWKRSMTPTTDSQIYVPGKWEIRIFFRFKNMKSFDRKYDIDIVIQIVKGLNNNQLLNILESVRRKLKETFH